MLRAKDSGQHADADIAASFQQAALDCVLDRLTRALDAMEASGDPAIAPAAKLLLDRYRFQLIADAGPLKAFQLTRK